MADPVTTDVEKRLNEMMAPYGNPARGKALMQRFRDLTMAMQFEGVPYDLIAWALAQHASSAVAAMKMAGAIRPELANALAQDFAETIQRADRGARELASKQ
jgi:hypothetical protein